MKLDLIMLANYAEAPNELLNVIGGGWDTINVIGPLEGAPPEVFAAMRGNLVVRLLFHPTETDREHAFAITIMGEDGQDIAAVDGKFGVPRNHELPTGWLQNVNMVLPLNGIPLPHPGNYVINLTVNGQWVGDRQFRVLKHYED